MGVEFYEGETMVRGLIEMLGENCAAYQSDFPHPQCNFPDSPKEMLGWDLWNQVGDLAKHKFFHGNAEKLMRIV